ncbi:MAG: 2OG-Fe(II) oxygenase [Burkholderiales bacterium]|nr:2OG-Fe(II) oxygenase [Burkholderiales bacterium]
MQPESPPASPILQSLQTLETLARPAKAGKTAALEPAGRFCAEGRLALDAVAVTVRNVGTLDRPVTSESATALHAASAPARHGRREATLLDKHVRDTGEIDASALSLEWAAGALASLQAEVAQALGVLCLEARLHNLLVYGPGQFFKPHQDTEKHPGMVATLVLVWPSAHIGGELRVCHRDTELHFASQHLRASAIRWFAFYADCRHEVAPVSEGWRIVLTFDLVLPAEPARPRTPVHPPLLDALRAHFHPEDGEPCLQPWVLLLDHEYTERGLRWRLLKGEDRARVAALQAACEPLGLTVHLALAAIHEQWTAIGAYGGRRGGVGEPEPDELIDEDMVLDFWVDADDRPLRRDALHVAPADTASFTETGEDFLVDEEYEGYMGNYGETLDYWYRRAALVIQTPLAAEASRFTTDFDAALADALALARGGRSDELSQRLEAAMKALRMQCQTRGRKLLGHYAELAVALPDAAQAHALCEGFAWNDLVPSDAAALACLARRWGAPWMQALLQNWTARSMAWRFSGWNDKQNDDVSPWPQSLAEFVLKGESAGLQAAVIDDILDRCRAALIAADKSFASFPPAVRSATLERRLQRVGDLAAALQRSTTAPQHQAALVRHVQAHPGLYPLRQLGPLLQHWPSDAVMLQPVQGLRAAVIQTLQQALDEPAPPAGDSSLHDVEWTCRCKDCGEVIAWAESANGQPLVLAMAESRRQHVQSRLQETGVALDTETVKQGSPHKLVIRKPPDLAARRSARRSAWTDDLAALGLRSRTAQR